MDHRVRKIFTSRKEDKEDKEDIQSLSWHRADVKELF